MTAAFKDWFSGSKVVDRNGEPLVVYHGTRRRGLSEAAEVAFDLKRSGDRTDMGNFGTGIYTTRHEWVAKGYAERHGSVIALYVNLKNPIRIPVVDGGYTRLIEDWGKALGVTAVPVWEGNAQRSREWADELRAKALGSGYDGVITETVDGEICAEVVVFRPDDLRTVKACMSPTVVVDGHLLPLNEDGTVTLYHGTTRAGAAGICRTHLLRSAGEPSVFLTTSIEAGYGDGTLLAVDVDPDLLRIDDEFPDGRCDFAIDSPSVRVSGARYMDEVILDAGNEAPTSPTALPR